MDCKQIPCTHEGDNAMKKNSFIVFLLLILVITSCNPNPNTNNTTPQINVPEDHYVKLESTTDWPPFRNPERVWVRVDKDGNISKRDHNDASYIMELDLTNEDLELFRKNKYIQGTNLWIDGFYIPAVDTSKGYAKLDKYPKDYLSSWQITFYWFEDNKWNRSLNYQTDSEFKFKLWKPITNEDPIFNKIWTDLSKIGNINIAYKEYLEDKPLTTVWNKQIQGSYMVEFNQIFKENIDFVASYNNPEYKNIGKSYAGMHGRLQTDTILTMKIFHNMDDSFNVVIKHKSTKPGELDTWYTSSTYLKCNSDFSIINGININ